MRRPRAEPRRDGLGRALERRIVRRRSRSLIGRMSVAAALRAAGLLLRKHPKVALEMAGAGLQAAGAEGVHALGERLDTGDRSAPDRPDAPAPAPTKRKRLKRRDLRRLRKALDAESRRLER